MRYNRAVLTAILAVALTACATPPDPSPLAAVEGNYVLDPQHTSITFSLSHAGLSQFTGRFDYISGQLNFVPDDPVQSRLDIHIDPASVNTGLPDFDAELATDSKYFDADNHPDIRFTSTGITTTSDNAGIITGDLFLKGKTNPVTLNVTFNGAGKSFGHPGKTLGFSATGTFKRSDFDMGYLTNFGIGDEMTLRIETEFNEAQ